MLRHLPDLAAHHLLHAVRPGLGAFERIPERIDAKEHRLAAKLFERRHHLLLDRDRLPRQLEVDVQVDAVGRHGQVGVSLVDVGEELDLSVKYTFNPNADLLIGYSWFFNGDMLQSAGRTSDGQFLYVQQTMRY